MILTALRLRQRLVDAVPECLRYSFAAGMLMLGAAVAALLGLSRMRRR